MFVDCNVNILKIIFRDFKVNFDVIGKKYYICEFYLFIFSLKMY